MVTLTLASGLTRDGGAVKKVVLAADVSRLRLVLPLREAATPGTYRVAIVSAEGREVWGSDLGLRGIATHELVVEAPAGAIPEGDYEVTVTAREHGTGEIAAFTFRLLRGP
jgi:hypothetical protein